MTTKPFPFQLEDVKQAEAWGGRCLIAHEMGLGKTFSALLYLYRNPHLRPAVVVCPASVKWVWEREAKAHFGLRAEVLEGTRPPRGGFRRPSPLYVVNYDVLGQRRAEGSGEGWLTFLRGLKPQVVAVDESHFLGNPRSKRTRWVRELCEGVPAVLALSGTPFTNRHAELWPTLNLLRPDLYPTFAEYARNYCPPQATYWGLKYDKSTNGGLLHRRLCRKLMVRRRKKDVLKDLPAKIRTVVPLGLSSRREYTKARDDFLGWLRETAPQKARRAARAEQVVKLGYLKRLAAKLKLPAACDWVDDWLGGGEGKLVLFAVHKAVIAELAGRYRGRCVVVDGSVTGRDRRRAVDQFQHDPRTRVFIGNVKAAGVGLTLTAASTLAFLELGWTPGDMLQAEDRIHRVGQTGTAQIVYLVARDTVEEKLLDVLQRKQKVLDQTLDGRGGAGGFDVFDQLTQLLAEEGK